MKRFRWTFWDNMDQGPRALGHRDRLARHRDRRHMDALGPWPDDEIELTREQLRYLSQRGQPVELVRRKEDL